MRILHRDELVVAVDKPAGVPSIPGRGYDGPTMWSLVRAEFPGALPVHRLDKDTTGVMAFALTKDAHRALNDVFEGRKAEKIYVAIATGDLAEPVRCELPLADARKGGMRVASTAESRAQPALTELAPLERFGAYTLVQCKPRTGRTHQIRVHLAALGHPLAVDPRYGDGRPDEKLQLSRTPLHAQSLRVPHPSGRGWLQVEAPLPEDLARALETLRRARRSGA